jgi:hypothetical protein
MRVALTLVEQAIVLPTSYTPVGPERHNRPVSGRLQRLRLIALGICIGVLLSVGSAFGLNRAALADLFGSNLIRAQVVIWNGAQDNEIWYAKGRITALGSGITVREKDGQVEHFDVAPGARITFGGVFVPLSSLRRGMLVQVFRPGDAPANRIDATLR